jgi:single-strand DNA-binding protein
MLIGRLGHDPDIRYTSKGTQVCSFRLATNRRVKRNEQWEDETDWHNVVVMGNDAEFLGKCLHKGHLVYVEGTLRNRSWVDTAGNKRYATEVVVDNFVLLERKVSEQDVLGESYGQEVPVEMDAPF